MSSPGDAPDVRCSGCSKLIPAAGAGSPPACRPCSLKPSCPGCGRPMNSREDAAGECDDCQRKRASRPAKPSAFPVAARA